MTVGLVAVVEAAVDAEVLAATSGGSKCCIFGDCKEEEGAHPLVGRKLLLDTNFKHDNMTIAWLNDI